MHNLNINVVVACLYEILNSLYLHEELTFLNIVNINVVVACLYEILNSLYSPTPSQKRKKKEKRERERERNLEKDKVIRVLIGSYLLTYRVYTDTCYKEVNEKDC